MSQNNYSRRLRNATWLAFLVPLAVMVPMSLMLRSVAPGEHFWLVLAGGLFVIGTTLWASMPWWRTMDDMQKQGQMLAWYWGGVGCGAAALMWLIAALGVDSDQFKGAMFVLIGQLIGFFAFWAVWMWRKRGEES